MYCDHLPGLSTSSRAGSPLFAFLAGDPFHPVARAASRVTLVGVRASLSGDNLCIAESRYAHDLVGDRYARY